MVGVNCSWVALNNNCRMNCKPKVTLYSYPRSGRQWLSRMMLDYLIETRLPGACLNSGKGKDTAVNKKKSQFMDILPVDFQRTHDACSSSDTWDKCILLVRNPLDCLNSYYYFVTARKQLLGKPSFDGDFQDFLLSERGLYRQISFLNSFEPILDDPALMVVSYESLRLNSEKALQSVLEHIGVDIEFPRLLTDVVQFHEFRNAQSRELATLSRRKVASRYRSEDQLHIRSGKINDTERQISTAHLKLIRAKLSGGVSSAVKKLLTGLGYQQAFDE